MLCRNCDWIKIHKPEDLPDGRHFGDLPMRQEIDSLLASDRKGDKMSNQQKKSIKCQVSRVKILGLVCFFTMYAVRCTLHCIYAQELELGRIVVTAKKGYERNVQSIPANITVIDSGDISTNRQLFWHLI